MLEIWEYPRNYWRYSVALKKGNWPETLTVFSLHWSCLIRIFPAFSLCIYWSFKTLKKSLPINIMLLMFQLIPTLSRFNHLTEDLPELLPLSDCQRMVKLWQANILSGYLWFVAQWVKHKWSPTQHLGLLVCESIAILPLKKNTHTRQLFWQRLSRP